MKKLKNYNIFSLKITVVKIFVCCLSIYLFLLLIVDLFALTIKTKTHTYPYIKG